MPVAGRNVVDEKALPLPGKEAICPHCKQLAVFKHFEQFPGDSPFKAYKHPAGANQFPIINVRKSICTRENCGQMVVVMESPNWTGTLVPYKQYK